MVFSTNMPRIDSTLGRRVGRKKLPVPASHHATHYLKANSTDSVEYLCDFVLDLFFFIPCISTASAMRVNLLISPNRPKRL